MLKRLNNKTVRGPNFIVSVPDIHRVKYTEGEKATSVEIEGGANSKNEVSWLIYSETLRGWDCPHEESEIPKTKREEILANICQSLCLLEMPHQLI